MLITVSNHKVDITLSNKAAEEMMQTGKTSVVCPYCHNTPVFNLSYTPKTKRLEHIDGRCSCGYVMYGAVSITYKPANNDKNFSMGYRKLSQEPLSKDEIKLVIDAANAINIPIDMLVFNDPQTLKGIIGTSYHFVDDKIYIAQNVFPDPRATTHPRDLMSVKAVLAHEYYGHRPYRQEYLNDQKTGVQTTPYWKDEARASINAAKYAPNLSQLERAWLIQDAVYRAQENAQILELDDYMRSILYGDGTEKPISLPLVFRPESEVKAELQQKLQSLYGSQHIKLQPDKLNSITFEKALKPVDIKSDVTKPGSTNIIPKIPIDREPL